MVTRTQPQTGAQGAPLEERSGSPLVPSGRSYDQGGARRNRVGRVDARWLARFLGVFSLGLGLAELAAPRQLKRLIGAPRLSDNLIRALGAREVLHALAIFSQAKPTAGIWSRVAGDAVDLAVLGSSFGQRGADEKRLAAATAVVCATTVLDLVTARDLSRVKPTLDDQGPFVRKAITINRSPDELYRFWRNFENLPRFMEHLEAVTVLDDRRSHWVATAPGGGTVEWDAEITSDRPNERIAWRSLPGAKVPNAGQVRFEPAPGDRGTVVRVEFDYNPPAGVLGAAVARLFGEEPNQQVAGDLRRFKQVMEIGEVVRSEATLRGTSLHDQRPARPTKGPVR
jgi:uncharacterized membrane protein